MSFGIEWLTGGTKFDAWNARVDVWPVEQCHQEVRGPHGRHKPRISYPDQAMKSNET